MNLLTKKPKKVALTEDVSTAVVAADKVKPALGSKKKPPAKKKISFTYKALDPSGKDVKGKQLATSQLRAHQALLDKGFTVLKIDVTKSILQYEFTKKKVKPQLVGDFSRQLAVYIDARVALPMALELIAGETPPGPFKVILDKLTSGVRSGRQFSELLGEYPEAFPTFYVGIIRSAELTSNLPAALRQLADYLDHDAKVMKKIISALIYPTMVMVMGVVVAVVAVLYVLPALEGLFRSLHAKLPLITKVLLDLAYFVQTMGPFVVAGCAIVFVMWLMARRTPPGKLILSRMVLKVPVVQGILRLSSLERITRVLSATLHAGVTLPEALDVAASATKNVVYKNAINDVREKILAGVSVTEAMSRNAIWPNSLRQLVLVGETSGALDRQLEVAGDIMYHDLDTKTSRALAMLEPAIMTLTGGFAAFVSIALVSTMYGMYSQVQVVH